MAWSLAIYRAGHLISNVDGGWKKMVSMHIYSGGWKKVNRLWIQDGSAFKSIFLGMDTYRVVISDPDNDVADIDMNTILNSQGPIDKPIHVDCLVTPNTNVVASTVDNLAFKFSTPLPAGSTMTLNIQGGIFGRPGRGGISINRIYSGDPFPAFGEQAEHGGTAMELGCDTIILVSTGYLFAGGGGGGSGFLLPGVSSGRSTAGGGGGGYPTDVGFPDWSSSDGNGGGFGDTGTLYLQGKGARGSLISGGIGQQFWSSAWRNLAEASGGDPGEAGGFTDSSDYTVGSGVYNAPGKAGGRAVNRNGFNLIVDAGPVPEDHIKGAYD